MIPVIGERFTYGRVPMAGSRQTVFKTRRMALRAPFIRRATAASRAIFPIYPTSD